jgi:hypothetical protein
MPSYEELYEKREEVQERWLEGEASWEELQEIEDRLTQKMMNGEV